MVSNLTDNSTCLLAVETNSNWGILTITAFIALLDVSSVILLSLYLVCYSTNKALHLNLRALSTTVTLALIIRNLSTFVRAMRMLITPIIAIVSSLPYSLTYKTLREKIEGDRPPFGQIGKISTDSDEIL